MRWFGIALLAVLACSPALADGGGMLDKGLGLFDGGKLLATGGVSAVEGAGGGGLATWALIGGYGTRDGIGINAHYTYVGLSDYTLQSVGAAIGIMDRV